MTEFGINLSFAVKRWPEPEAWAAFVRQELGLDLVQFSFDLLDPWWPDDLAGPLAARVKTAAGAHGLAIHSAFVGLAAYEMGAAAVGGPVGGMGVRDLADPAIRRARYAELVTTFGELTDYAAARGLTEILIEPTPLPREIPWTVTEATALLDDLGATAVPVRYCLDVGHALYQPLYGDEARLEPWMGELGDRIGMVHLQQTDEVAELMARSGVKAPLVLEVFYPFELADEAVRSDIVASVVACRDALATA